MVYDGKGIVYVMFLEFGLIECGCYFLFFEYFYVEVSNNCGNFVFYGCVVLFFWFIILNVCGF